MKSESQHNQELINAHLEALDPECRWCFAVDMERVKGTILDKYKFLDGTVILLFCPRCYAEFSYVVQCWDENYLKGIIHNLHPELGTLTDDRLFRKINNRVFPEYMDI